MSTQPNLLLRQYGMRRSGNHPINLWLRRNLQGFTDLTDTSEWYSVHNDVYAPDYQRPKIHSPHDMRVEAPKKGKGLLVVSYEDVPISLIPEISITEKDHVLDNAIIRDVLIIRDPFNMVASRLASQRKLGDQAFAATTPLESTMERWKDYAKEFKRIKDGQPSQFKDPIIINYNVWKSNKTYRDLLLHSYFGVENLDLGVNEVPPQGFGSSFTGMDFQNRGLQMDTEERWKVFVNDPEYRSIFKDREIVNLSNDIWFIPGTEQIWDTYSSPEGTHRSLAERK